VIEGNYIHHLVGPTVSQGDGIEIKDGSWGNLIRDNVIHDTQFPGITVYGTDGKRRNVIERNAIWNSGDHGIQAAADAIIRNNVVRNTEGFGIYSRNHQSAVVGNLEIVNNTVLDDSSIRVIAPDQFSGPVRIANNAVSGQLRLPQHRSLRVLANTGGIDELFPTAGSPCRGAAETKYLPGDDFNGSPRDGAADTGAYRFAPGGNPGWSIGPDFKPLPSR
jgi:hypothetical protein